MNPVVRDCRITVDNTSQPAILLAGGMGARIYNNTFTGAGSNPTYVVRATVAYTDLQVWGNTVNEAARFFEGSITNSIVRDNECGTLSTRGIDVTGGSNNQILRNTMTVTAATNGIGVRFQSANTVISENRIRTTTGTTNHGIGAASGASNATITKNIVMSAGGAGIALTDASNASFVIEENQISNAGAGGIAAGQGSNHTIRNNVITSVSGGHGINSAGNNVIEGNRIITVTGTNFHGINAAANDKVRFNLINGVANGYGINAGAGNIEVVQNEITAVAQHGIRVNGSNVVVSGNTVRNVTGSGQAGVYVEPGAVNTRIENNNIENVTGGGAGVEITADNQTILNNVIINVSAGIGIDLQTRSNVVVQGNRVTRTGQDGILLRAGANNTIKGNTVTDAALNAVSPTTNPFAAIRLGTTGAATNNVVEGNTIVNAGSTSYAVGIHLGSAGSDNNRIVGNTVKDFTRVSTLVTAVAIGILVETGMNNVVEGNTITNTGNIKLGIDIRTPNVLILKGNTVEGMTEAGLKLRGGTVTFRLKVEGNKLTRNVTGISLGPGAADVTSANIVEGGSTALYVEPLGNAANYKVEGNCFTAPVLARNDGLGTLVAKKNYWGATPQPGVNVFGDVDTSDPLASCPGAPAPTPTLSKNYGARAGWYMVSVPTTGDTAGIFGVTLYWWNGTTYTQYTGTAAIEPVKGYWANLPANKTVTASGSVPTTDQTVALVKGWNMISVPWAYPKAAIQVQKGTETKSWADAVAAGWVRDTIWGYDGAYQSVTTLDPWYGYWVRALVDGLSLKFAYASRLTTMCVSCLEAKAVVPEGEELPPAPPAASAAEFKFVNVPNPIRDVHTTTFKVLGPLASMVTEIKVQVFDLTGKLVWEGTASGAELTWHTDDLTGAYLANGVYLYKVYVKVGDAWISSGVLKLVIQR
jgi:parallel beta-helix repeat protein